MNRDYLGLWLLLLVALVIVAGYSCMDTVKIGNTEIRSSGIADRLTATGEKNRFDPDIREEMPGYDEPVAPLDTAKQTILLIGDSTLDALNPAMAAYAKANGHKLYSVIWYSSTTEYWGSCDTLRVFLKRFKPSYIFISLGANELFVTNIAEKRERYLQHLMEQIGDIPYLWMGPPNWKPDTGINAMISRNTRHGSYFRTDGMELDRQADGAHPTLAASRQWLDSVARWMPLHAAHPILMNTPDSTVTARPERVVVLQPKR